MGDEGPKSGRDEEMCRAIGRYVVEFSQLVFVMRAMLARRLTAGGPGEPTTIADLVLGQHTATQLADAFFAVCLADGRLDENEKKIGRALRARVIREANENRNDLAHGDWWVSSPMYGVEELPAMLARVKPAKERDTHIYTHLTAKQVDEWSDAVYEIGQFVVGFGAIALGRDPEGHRVSDMFELKDKRVVLRGSW